MLVTRPLPEAEETARRLRLLRCTPVLAPLLEIRTRALAAAGRPQAVLVTSGNAVAALPAALLDLPVLAVGDATAERLRRAGWRDVHSAGGDAAALAELAARRCHPAGGPLLLACGAGLGQTLTADLRGRGLRVLRRVAYATQPVAALPETARIALEQGTLRAALFFSAATARVFMNILQRDRAAAAVAGMEAMAISSATAAVLRPLPWLRLRVAASPTQDELLALLS